jgi:hypothetical protein
MRTNINPKNKPAKIPITAPNPGIREPKEPKKTFKSSIKPPVTLEVKSRN